MLTGLNSCLLQVANLLNEEIPQIFTLCGTGPRSSLRLLRPGLAVTEMAVSPLPGNPTAVWTIKRSMLDDFDAYIIVSFTNATLVSALPTIRSGHVKPCQVHAAVAQVIWTEFHACILVPRWPAVGCEVAAQHLHGTGHSTSVAPSPGAEVFNQSNQWIQAF